MIQRYRVFLIHVGAWLAYATYEAVGSLIENGSVNSNTYLGFSFIFVRMVQFYFCYLWLFPKFGRGNKIIQLLIGILGAFVLFTSLRYAIEEVLYPLLFNRSNYGEGTTIGFYIADNIYWGSPGITWAAIIWSIENARKRDRENKQLKEDAIKAELAFLRSQINPHFLYNTLNYIYSLAIPVSEQLAAAIIKLSDLMRYSLKESPGGKVKLSQEVQYINDYIELFKMRFSDFYVEFNTTGAEDGHNVPALILIPFVENAFKHGVVNDAQRPVRINLSVVGNRLSFSVSNKINRNQKDQSSGVGLANIRRRLEILLPDKHELMISENGQTYKATLNILL